jgi:hypothetical protein
MEIKVNKVINMWLLILICVTLASLSTHYLIGYGLSMESILLAATALTWCKVNDRKPKAS